MNNETSSWTIEDSNDLYRIQNWADKYFSVNNAGNMSVKINDNDETDLIKLSNYLIDHGFRFPLLIRFPDILKKRIDLIAEGFRQAFSTEDVDGNYTAIYPIKVNQQNSVIETISSHPLSGLEAGSKSELIIVLGKAKIKSTIVCNGYKDREYIRLALIGLKMGHSIYIIIEKLSELYIVIEESKKMEVTPLIGVRIKMSSVGQGKWQNTGGEKSKFGLSALQVIEMIDILEQSKLLSSVKVLHFHLGSQISNINDIEKGMIEGSRYYVQLRKMGLDIEICDIGGGLAIDYEGRKEITDCSSNYDVFNYASTVVRSINKACVEGNEPFPKIMTESGRFMTAHHAVLVSNIIDTEVRKHLANNKLLSVNDSKENLNFEEIKRDFISSSDSFLNGEISLLEKAKIENLFNYMVEKNQETFDDNTSTDKYFCNFSLFQSIPDAWGVDQLFPVVPLQSLDKKPTRNATIQDLTCDSDGSIKRYSISGQIRETMPIHDIKDKSSPYLIGIFLVGAYQEILGDLHNLFGDTDSVSIRLSDVGDYSIYEEDHGDTIDELLKMMHIEPKKIVSSCKRKLVSSGIDRDLLVSSLREIESGLIGYTYLED